MALVSQRENYTHTCDWFSVYVVSVFPLILSISVMSYTRAELQSVLMPAMGHWGTCPLDFQQFIFSQLTLELHKVWQRLCAIACPNIFVLCNISCGSSAVATRTFLWSPYVIWQTIIFSCCGLFFFFLFFPRLISAAADWMSTILRHMVWS